MKVTFIEPADIELEDAVDFYNDQLSGLVLSLYDEVMAGIKLITDFPTAWKRVGPRTRKCLLRRFPYFILYIVKLYIVKDNELVITAIGHQHRDPMYFSDRIV